MIQAKCHLYPSSAASGVLSRFAKGGKMKLRHEVKLKILFSLVCGSISYSQTTTVNLGGTPIYLPAPVGFHEISTLSPENKRIAELSTYKNNRLLAVYYSEGDVGRIMKNENAELSKYMLVQTMDSAVKRKTSKSQFRDLADGIKDDQYKLWNQYKHKVEPWMEKTSSNIADAYNFINFEMKIGEPVPLGVFYDTPEAFSFAMLTKFSTSAEGENFESVIIGGSNIMLINNKMLFVYVYANFHSQDDIDWVRSISKSWLESIQSSN